MKNSLLFKLPYAVSVLSFSLLFLLPCQANAIKKVRGEVCLRTLESLKKNCKQENSDLNTDTKNNSSRFCKILKKRERNVCDTKRLKCFPDDSLVCGVISCDPPRACPFGDIQKTFNNVCELRNSSAVFKKKGACNSDVSSDNCSTTARVCGFLPCDRGIQSQDPEVDKLICLETQIYPNLCALKKAGARQIADKLCNGLTNKK